jgi:hypothetical protein
MIRTISRAALSVAFVGILTGAAMAQPFAYATSSLSDSV